MYPEESSTTGGRAIMNSSDSITFGINKKTLSIFQPNVQEHLRIWKSKYHKNRFTINFLDDQIWYEGDANYYFYEMAGDKMIHMETAGEWHGQGNTGGKLGLGWFPKNTVVIKEGFFRGMPFLYIHLHNCHKASYEFPSPQLTA